MIAAAAVSLLWCLFATWLGPRVGYLDVPDDSELKVHRKPAVPLGGVGVYLGIHLASVIEGEVDPYLLAATTLVLVLGLVDDRRGLPPVFRLSVELIAAVLLVAGLASDRDPAELVMSVLLVVVAINAVNLFDGLDGLAGSTGIVTALGLFWLGSNRGVDSWMAMALAAALVGFLVLGWHPARVFLGDSGAYVTGMVLAAAMIEVSPGGPSQLLTAAALLGVFVIDLAVTLVRRRRAHHPLFLGDRSHLYDQLADRGWGLTRIVYSIVLAQIVLVVVIVTVDRLVTGVAGVVAVSAVLLGVIGMLARSGFLRMGTS